MGAFLNSLIEEGSITDLLYWIEKISLEKNKPILLDLSKHWPNRKLLIEELVRLETEK